MALQDYLTGATGILKNSPYLLMFILTINPALIRGMKWWHFIFLGIGAVLSVFNHRAIIPFYLMVLLDLDYDKIDMKAVGFFFFATLLIYGAFGKWN